MTLLIPDEKCLVLRHENFSFSGKKRNRPSSGTSGAVCSWSSPIAAASHYIITKATDRTLTERLHHGPLFADAGIRKKKNNSFVETSSVRCSTSTSTHSFAFICHSFWPVECLFRVSTNSLWLGSQTSMREINFRGHFLGKGRNGTGWRMGN